MIAIRYIHKKGYIHGDIKPDNAAYGIQDEIPGEPQDDVSLNSRAYLFGRCCYQNSSFTNCENLCGKADLW